MDSQATLVDEPSASQAIASTDAAATIEPSHNWAILSANKYARLYFCQNCHVKVGEKKQDGYWAPDKFIVCEPRADESSPETVTATPPTPTIPPAAPLPAERPREDEDNDSDDAMSIYESAAEEEFAPSPRVSFDAPPSPPRSHDAPRRSSAGRSSMGTTNSDAPSSLAGLPYLTRLPRISGRAGADVSVPVGRPRQVSSRRTSAAVWESVPTPASPAQALPPSNVSSRRSSAAPCPLRPVATLDAGDCPGGADHSWKVKWASGTHRHYKCVQPECGMIVKERKFGHPEVWIPA
ncbi:hypothetical protein OH76DRAFT_1459234 [Lentinus brumalis]|uniref:Uncharacterized protein n=1 Tax=Lentinus brumalis TaxID=2498619 RepID=A0A371CLQ6_9APHY|nr:hypothetical protein OH76DRAFT_1459234 [Polyporus brumalis]